MDKKDHPGTPHSHRRWKIPFKNSDPVKHRIAITKNFDNFDFNKNTTFLFKWFLFLTIHPILFPKDVNPFRPFHIYFFVPSGVGPESSFVPRIWSQWCSGSLSFWPSGIFTLHGDEREMEGRLKQGLQQAGCFLRRIGPGHLGCGVWYSLFSALPRKFSIFTDIFRIGWNHQPVIIYEEKWELGCTNLRSSCKKKKHLVEESRRHSDHNFSPKG